MSDGITIEEGLNIPKPFEKLCEEAGEYIASFFLVFFKYRVDHYKSVEFQRPERLRKLEDEHDRLEKYRLMGKNVFTISTSHIATNWGPANFSISPKQKFNPMAFPDIIIKIKEHHEPDGVDGYYEPEPKKIFVVVSKYHFSMYFDRTLEFLQETLKHELRHHMQLSKFVGNSPTGLPKRSVMSKQHNVYGNPTLEPELGGQEKGHIHRDIEFKPNVHTYAHFIKNYLMKQQPEERRKPVFAAIISGNFRPKVDSVIADMVGRLRMLYLGDYGKWRLFAKEVYKEVFGR